MDFNDFLTRGLVEYVDVNEENNSLIALYEADITPQVRDDQVIPTCWPHGRYTLGLNSM